MRGNTRSKVSSTNFYFLFSFFIFILLFLLFLFFFFFYSPQTFSSVNIYVVKCQAKDLIAKDHLPLHQVDSYFAIYTNPRPGVYHSFLCLLYHIISYHIISYHIISYHIISYHIISYHIISYHIISYNIIYDIIIL